jgi:hypothetical protein
MIRTSLALIALIAALAPAVRTQARPAARSNSAIQAFYECFNAPHYALEYEGARMRRHPAGLTLTGDEPGMTGTNAPPMHRFAVPRGLTLFGLHPTILRLTESPSASFAQSPAQVVRAIRARFPQAQAEPLPPDGTRLSWRGRSLEVTGHFVFTNLQSGEPRQEPGADVLCIS